MSEPIKFLVVSRVDVEPVGVAEFEDYRSARQVFDRLSQNWSEVYLCKVLEGPGALRAPVEKIRLLLELSRDVDDSLEAMAAERGTTKSEILRKAIALMEVCHAAVRRGQTVVLADQDNNVETTIVGIV